MTFSESLLENLYSTKSKDKNMAIEYIERQLDSDTFQPPNSWKSLLLALTHCIENEQNCMNESKAASAKTKHERMLSTLATLLKKITMMAVQCGNLDDSFLDPLVKHMLSVLPLMNGLFKPLASIYGNILRHLMNMADYSSLLPTTYFHYIFKLCRLSLIGGDQENEYQESKGISQENVDFARILFLLVVHYPKDLSSNASQMAYDVLHVVEYCLKQKTRSLQMDEILRFLSNFILLEWSLNDLQRSLEFCNSLFHSNLYRGGTMDPLKTLFYRIYCELIYIDLFYSDLTVSENEMDNQMDNEMEHESYHNVPLHMQYIINSILPSKLQQISLRDSFEFSHLPDSNDLQQLLSVCILLLVKTNPEINFKTTVADPLQSTVVYILCHDFARYLNSHLKIQLLDWIHSKESKSDWMYSCIVNLMDTDMSKDSFKDYLNQTPSEMSLLMIISRYIQVYGDVDYIQTHFNDKIESAMNLIYSNQISIDESLVVLPRLVYICIYKNTSIHPLSWMNTTQLGRLLISKFDLNSNFCKILECVFALYGIYGISNSQMEPEDWIDRPRYSYEHPKEYETWSFQLFTRNCRVICHGPEMIWNSFGNSF